jgi:CelD/BcsL family acetyltransferase involved in cellulose biosynthesis
MRQVIEPLNIPDWQAFDAEHPAPTFFARPAWALALAHAYPHLKPNPVWVTCPGKRVLIPLVRSAGGRLHWRELVGMPLGTYTCALGEDGAPVQGDEFEAAIAALTRSCDALVLVPWPFAPTLRTHALHRTSHDTAAIDLSAGIDEVMRGVAGVTRRMAGQAERRGVECRPCRSGLAVGTYYGILREAAERWGLARPTFPKELLEGLVTYGGPDVEIWLAECNGHPIAGGVVLFGSQELFFWSAAMRQEFAQLRPSNALNLSLMRMAAERGIRWYNLGASDGLPGVERFKRGLGARTVPYAALSHQSKAFGVFSRVRASMQHLSVRSAWRAQERS